MTKYCLDCERLNLLLRVFWNDADRRRLLLEEKRRHLARRHRYWWRDYREFSPADIMFAWAN